MKTTYRLKKLQVLVFFLIFCTELWYNSDYSTILYILHGSIEERYFLQNFIADCFLIHTCVLKLLKMNNLCSTKYISVARWNVLWIPALRQNRSLGDRIKQQQREDAVKIDLDDRPLISLCSEQRLLRHSYGGWMDNLVGGSVGRSISS